MMAVLRVAVAQGGPHVLEPVKAIGAAWQEDAASWMSYVAFSADGSQVVSDGPAVKLPP